MLLKWLLKKKTQKYNGKPIYDGLVADCFEYSSVSGSRESVYQLSDC
jgi:hypothetical protein